MIARTKSYMLEPGLDRLIVKRCEAPETSEDGSILLPDEVRKKERPHEGIVLAIGPVSVNDSGFARNVSHVHVGDRVLYGKYAGSEVEIQGEEFVFLRPDDVVCVLVPLATLEEAVVE